MCGFSKDTINERLSKDAVDERFNPKIRWMSVLIQIRYKKIPHKAEF
ncbi:hypothetical protein [Methanolapillus ohkumae]